MEVLLYPMRFFIALSFIIAYLALSMFVVRIVNCKKEWLGALTFIGAIVLTPILFLLLWMPIQYIYDKKMGYLN